MNLIKFEKFNFVNKGSINPKTSLVILSPLIFWYVSLFPAVLTPDSFAVIKSIKSGSISGFHTVAYELFVKILSFDTKAIFLVSLTQLLLNYYALYLVIRFLAQNIAQVKINALYLTSALFFTPFFGPISMTIWKDNLHNAFIIIGFIKLIEESKGLDVNKKVIKKKFLPLLLISLGIAARHEALYGFLILGVIALLFNSFTLKFCSKLNLRKIVSLSILVALLGWIFNFALQTVTSSKEIPRYQKTLSFLLDLQFVNYNYPEMLDEESRKILNEISSGPSLMGAGNCGNTYNFWNVGFDEKKADYYSLKIPRIWLSSMKSNARDTILFTRFCRTASVIPWPFSSRPTNGYWPTTGISPNNLGFENPKITFFFYSLVFAWSYLWGLNLGFVAWPSVHLTFLFLLSMICLRKIELKPDIRLGIAAITLYFFSRSILLFLTTASQEFRYMSAIYFFTVPAFALCLIRFLQTKAPIDRSVNQ